MSYDLSDEEFCETNFIEPSPLKKRNLPLTNAKEWKEKLEKRAILRRKLHQAESDFLSFFESKLVNKKDKDLTLKTAGGDNISVIKGENPDNNIHLFPEGRPFFDEQFNANTPIKADSPYSLDEFLKLVEQGFLLQKRNIDNKESGYLRTFCLKVLKKPQEALTINLILQFLSSQYFPYEEVALKTWYCSSFSKLIQCLEKSLKNYSARECQELFRQCCLSALDRKTFTYTHVYSSVLSACLQNSSNEFPVSEEIEWIYNLQLLPEESFHLLKVLPQNGPFADFGFLFACRVLQAFLKPTTILPKLDFKDVVLLLKTHEAKIRTFSMNEIFHFSNILDYIILRLPVDSDSYAALKEIIYSVEHFKNYYQQDKSVSFYVVSECINRICLTMQQRIPLNSDECPVQKKPDDVRQE